MLLSTTLPEMLYSINDSLANKNILIYLGTGFIVSLFITIFVFGVDVRKKIAKTNLSLFWIVVLAFYLPFGLSEFFAYAKDSASGLGKPVETTDVRQIKRFCEMMRNQGGLAACYLDDLMPYLEKIPAKSKVYYDSMGEMFAIHIRHQLNGRYELVDDPNEAEYLVFFASSNKYEMTKKGELFRDKQKLAGTYEILKQWDGQTSLLKRK